MKRLALIITSILYSVVLFAQVPGAGASAADVTEMSDLHSAEFVGGMPALYRYVLKTVSYPEEAVRLRQQDDVYVSFIVDETGRVTDVKVVKGEYPVLNAEAARVVRSLPNWHPAVIDGIPTITRFTLPVTFVLR